MAEIAVEMDIGFEFKFEKLKSTSKSKSNKYHADRHLGAKSIKCHANDWVIVLVSHGAQVKFAM